MAPGDVVSIEESTYSDVVDVPCGLDQGTIGSVRRIDNDGNANIDSPGVGPNGEMSHRLFANKFNTLSVFRASVPSFCPPGFA